MIAAASVRAAQKLAPGRPLRSLLVNFVGPIDPGTAELKVVSNRAGRSLTHASVTVMQNGSARTLVNAVFGETRTTALKKPPSTLEFPDVRGLSDLEFDEGVAPEFSRRFRFRWSVDTFPFLANQESRVSGFVQYREPVAYGDWGIIAMLDAWPPPVFCWADGLAMGSTVSWQINFLKPPGVVKDNPWWFYDAQANHAVGGYSDSEARIFDASGEPVAISRQLFAEFTKPVGPEAALPRTGD